MCRQAKKISIPSGAIKRIKENFNLKQCLLFQFLLVRLKGAGREIQRQLNKKEFQFLLVRLKAVEQTKDEKNASTFQFLLVRLKVADFQYALALFKIFQFLLVRLKVSFL